MPIEKSTQVQFKDDSSHLATSRHTANGAHFTGMIIIVLYWRVTVDAGQANILPKHDCKWKFVC